MTGESSAFNRPLFDPHVLAGMDIPASMGLEPYLYGDKQIVAAVNVAMATERPLLVTGPPGSGKSTLARSVAHELNWTYIDSVITSRTELSDLTEGYDAIRRLADAQAERKLAPRWAYVDPGTLWWAYAPTSALRRGQELDTPGLDEQVPPPDPRHRSPGARPATVLLLDEIDKAEPDLPNDLLGPLDRRGFATREAGWQQAEHDLLIIITSNGERRLPPAFLRRCVHLDLLPPSRDLLVAIAGRRLGEQHRDLFDALVDEFEDSRALARDYGRREPSTAEFLDAARACVRFNVGPGRGSAVWQSIMKAALWKSEGAADGTSSRDALET